MLDVIDGPSFYLSAEDCNVVDLRSPLFSTTDSSRKYNINISEQNKLELSVVLKVGCQICSKSRAQKWHNPIKVLFLGGIKLGFQSMQQSITRSLELIAFRVDYYHVRNAALKLHCKICPTKCMLRGFVAAVPTNFLPNYIFDAYHAK